MNMCLQGLVSSMLVWIWCQSSIILIRPIFVWGYGNTPSIDSVATVQKYYPWLLVAAFVGTALQNIFLFESNSIEYYV